ncbi:MAG: undecaprenyl-diphosphate phosphatase [Elusimicrobia bacterium]|nr:undecaprenyl-diphosphate phosphatase [Elusimicrobiota bacterium]
MLEHIILGAIQGVTEWVPVSSKTCVMLAKTHLFGSQESTNELLRYALLLHLGTFGAALTFFWKDILGAFRAIVPGRSAETKDRKVLLFLITTTILTGIGLVLNQHFALLVHRAPNAKTALTGLIGIMLLITGALQIRTARLGQKTSANLSWIDGVLLGMAQALATLPGMSRAGTTMAALSWRGFDQEHTLKLSFLMSLPVIFAGNILLNYRAFLVLDERWIGVLSAFGVGLLSVRGILTWAKKVRFGLFLVGIGGILLTATALTAMIPWLRLID